MDLAACDGIGQSQDGLITRRQALRVLTKNQVNLFVAQNVWSSIYPGVYRMTGVPDSWHRRVRAATLVRLDVLASHHTAAYLWGLIDRLPRDIEVLTKVGRSTDLPRVIVHRTRRWFPEMRTVAGGIPTTRPARTLIDMSTRCSLQTLQSAVDRALTRRILGFDELVDEFQRIGERAGRNLSVMAAVIPKRTSQYEKLESLGEVDILDWIKEVDLPIPVEQFRVPVGPDDTFRPDYAYPDRKIAIEVQSWGWHGGPTQYEKDAQKAITLASMGWIILPVLPRVESKIAFQQALALTLASRSAA
jgi:hypothetical protein